MATLADHQIEALCIAGMVSPYDPDLLNPGSLDLRLGGTLLIESVESPDLKPYPLQIHSQENPYRLQPGQFVLAPTFEWVKIPDDLCAQFILKSSRGREGIEHLFAGFIDAGFEGILTLELLNARQLHPVSIWPGMRIGQLVFERLDAPPRRSYRETGRYCGDTTVQGSRG